MFSATLFSQNDPLKFYIDCRCDKNFVRQEVSYVDHVRDQAQANVQLFIYDITNGMGGRSYTLDFKGVGGLESITKELTYDTSANMTSDMVRKGLVKKIASGLLPYLLESGMEDRITYSVSKEETEDKENEEDDDPWNSWIFEINGQTNLHKESSRRSFDYVIGFETDRITEKWRIRTDLQVNQANSRFIRDDEEFTSRRERYFGYGSIVRSLSDHWSAGIFGGASYDTYTNLDLSMNITPAIEYNIFPYREVLKREIVFAYKIGFAYNDYIETTIFGEDMESRFQHSMDVQVRFRQPWGSVYSRIRASSFLEDFAKNRFQFYSSLSVRLIKGLSARLTSNFELIRDQVNLPAGSASLEDVLLQQKQIATDFQLRTGVGLSYTFGSAFNNIINTRL
jgi:uncharacterized protein DUF481